MESRGDEWYIEVSDSSWDKYTGDTSNLWHILNEFDEIKSEQNTETEEIKEPETVTIEPNN